MKLTTDSLTAETQALLSRLLPDGFRYFKSYRHFRKQFPGGLSYVSINAVTHDHSIYYLAFYLAVRVDELEQRIKSVWGDGATLSHYDRSIWCYTVNVGPSSPHWAFRISGSWAFQSLDEFPESVESISAFVRELAAPYLLAHERPKAIRETLLERLGRANNLYPYEQILTLDVMRGADENLESDLAILEERYADHVPQFRERFHAFREKVLGAR